MNPEFPARLNRIYLLLRLTYGLVPVAAGLDKFTNLLVDWKTYLPSVVAERLPVSPATFMHGVGVIEIVAGLVVLLGLTRLGAHVVMLWLVAIAATVSLGGHFDIAVRDLVMAIGAFVLGRVAALRGDAWLPAGRAHHAPSPA